MQVVVTVHAETLRGETMKVSVRSIAVIALMSVGLVAPAAASQAASQPTAGASISPVIPRDKRLVLPPPAHLRLRNAGGC